MPTEELERPKKTERLIRCRSSKSWGNTELLNEWLFLLNECHWERIAVLHFSVLRIVG